MKQFCLYVVLLVFSTISVVSQEIRIEQDVDFDTTYIKTNYNDLVVALNVTDKSHDFSLNVNERLYSYEINNPLSLGLSVDYRWFGLGVSLPLNKSNLDGVKTESFGMRFGYYSRKWWFTNYYQYYKGYKRISSEELIGKYPNLNTKTYQMMLSYGFNYKKYSQVATLWQLDRQKKCQGSFIAGLNFIYNKIASEKDKEINQENVALKRMEGVTYGLKFGYVYTLVFGKKMHASLALTPGFAFNNYIVHAEGTRFKEDNKIHNYVDSFLGIGYNGDKLLYGCNLTLNSNSLEVSNFEITNTNIFIRFYLGYKFCLNGKRLNFLGL